MALLALLAGPAEARKKKKPEPVPAAPVASVKTGVELWRAGDYAAAVAMWQPYANGGDADAMFNIGQAYKLGRAVPRDSLVARDWYRRAAVKGHLPAQANLGILLFQAGEKPEAIRWLKAAADKNELRAQYVLGVAHWNGDGVPRSMTLAYGYLARSSALGLPDATTALQKLTAMISPIERANGWAVATSLAAGQGVPYEFAGGMPGNLPTGTASIDRYSPSQVIKPLPRPIEPPRPASPALVPPPVAIAAALPAGAPAPNAPPRVAPSAASSRPGFTLLPPASPPVAVAAAAPAPRPAPPVAVAAVALAPPPAPATTAPKSPGTAPQTPALRPPPPAAPRPAPVNLAAATPSSPPLAAPSAPRAAPATAPISPAARPPALAARPVAPPVTTVAIPASAPPAAAPGAAPPAAVKPAPRPVELATAAPPSKAPPAAAPATIPKTPPKPAAAAAPTAARPEPSGWRVQLGAFSKRGQAEAAWTEVQAKQKTLVAKSKPIFTADGTVTKLQIGPFATREAARDTCAKIAFAGRACFVTQG